MQNRHKNDMRGVVFQRAIFASIDAVCFYLNSFRSIYRYIDDIGYKYMIQCIYKRPFNPIAFIKFFSQTNNSNIHYFLKKTKAKILNNSPMSIEISTSKYIYSKIAVHCLVCWLILGVLLSILA